MVDALILQRRCKAVGIEWSGDYENMVYELAEFLHEKLGSPGDSGHQHPIHSGACPGYVDTDKVVCGITIDDLIDIGRRAGWIEAADA